MLHRKWTFYKLVRGRTAKYNINNPQRNGENTTNTFLYLSIASEERFMKLIRKILSISSLKEST